MELDFIPDGYEFPAYIKARPGLHREFRFTFRPFTQQEVIALSTKRDRAETNEEKARIQAEAVAPRIKTWSAKMPDGGTVAINSANLLRLTPTLHDSVCGIVLGYWPSDDDPKTGESGKTTSQLLETEQKN